MEAIDFALCDEMLSSLLGRAAAILSIGGEGLGFLRSLPINLFTFIPAYFNPIQGMSGGLYS
jgi:hypothetical protein